MLRRLHPDQPESFAFTPENRAWAEAQITKYPEGRQASAVIPLLWRAQEQEGWLSRPAIEEIGRMLDMAFIRVLEVATFYFMFQLQPVGRVAHVQVCGTTSCMICGAEDLIAVCRDKIATGAHQISADGKFSWEEVECLGACANAPMVQIGKDYYEDLTAESFAGLLDAFARGEVPVPGSQTGRFASEPASGLTSLDTGETRTDANASVALANRLHDTIRRIDGTEVPLITPWRRAGTAGLEPPRRHDDLLGPDGGIQSPTPGAQPSANAPADDTGVTKQEAREKDRARPDEGDVAPDTKGGEVPAGHAPGGSRATPEPAPGAGRDAAVDDAPGPLESQTARSAAPDRAPGTRPAASKERAAGSDPSRLAAAADLPDDQTRKPAGLDRPRDGSADDLKRIKGVGPKLADMLNGMGVYHFDQIAGWSAEEIAWVDRNLEGFRGRVLRDEWVPQADRLAAGGETD